MNTTLPNTYTRLCYIESTGTQYIDTGVQYDSSAEFVVDMQLSFTDVSKTDQCMGFTGNQGRYFGLYYNTWYLTNVTATVGTIYNIKFTEGTNACSTSCNGVFATTSYNVSIPTPTFLLFATHEGISSGTYHSTTTYFTKARIYICRIYKDGKMIRNLIPCKKNSNSHLGLYDTINSNFYENFGSGTFTAGPEHAEVGYNRYVIHLGNDTYASAVLGNYNFDVKGDLEEAFKELPKLSDYISVVITPENTFVDVDFTSTINPDTLDNFLIYINGYVTDSDSEETYDDYYDFTWSSAGSTWTATTTFDGPGTDVEEYWFEFVFSADGYQDYSVIISG